MNWWVIVGLSLDAVGAVGFAAQILSRRWARETERSMRRGAAFSDTFSADFDTHAGIDEARRRTVRRAWMFVGLLVCGFGLQIVGQL
ncbi:MAG: hypothetical protein F4091_06980 [Acidimicrobiales bacterium]|nr:hypothetical protein [Acidimicrobiales bacterium]MYF08301.1 hypothetical protein [Rhodospirillaceae bacterium]MYJ65191.1 hypothetical protein [Acidimicrobiales bacterium]